MEGTGILSNLEGEAPCSPESTCADSHSSLSLLCISRSSLSILARARTLPVHRCVLFSATRILSKLVLISTDAQS